MKMIATMLAALSMAASAQAERLGPKQGPMSSTAYCLSGIMANGRGVHLGAVASNRHPLGTLLKTYRRIWVEGRHKRYFRVEDRIGYGTALDLWMPSCGSAINYGRRSISYRVVKKR